MDLAVILSRAVVGMQSPLVSVEVHLSNGLPAFSIVGLPETSVKESKERVRSALINAGFDFPAKRITVNLAPADLPKEGGRFDLPIAIGILVASGQCKSEQIAQAEFTGELALSGELRPVQGVIPIVLAAQNAKRLLILPEANGAEAALIEAQNCRTSHHLLSVTAWLNGQHQLDFANAQASESAAHSHSANIPDMQDVIGQHQAKRALMIAAAGQHHLLFYGPPGTGKTMLASRLPGILPSMTEAEALQSASVYSISHQGFNAEQWRRRPFRAPHHSSSAVALVGGGSHPKPGEISLAHQGVLFLDELPEFDRKVLDMLRQPLESGTVTISRAARQLDFPARFQLIAAMNPSPCGNWGNPNVPCRSTPDEIRRYLNKLSGPLLDRFDISLEVPSIPPEQLHQGKADGLNSAQIRQQIEAARAIQIQRQGSPNSQLSGQQLQHVCSLDTEQLQFLQKVVIQFGLSARAHQRILKVARTIADIEQHPRITQKHLSEAVGYRAIDRLMRQLAS
ncbi:YifB family Mg chelatase-like AAA ATPase [Echinimonas agarilytica]|uniref:YifB family Mg chelatase-like AAA ATPase n=1 Tax=Echinimonas agarilytica TaxID=1215918 RepID=A0AA42B5Y4_9GAMM|nr:YifB family Mg chelatase-like AAA ATPase [Echinimonas agarilytica]MCM2678203.1 YifB family Mg chelatase-like AAA ATPase [Echinimonas agarilytica]